MGLGSCLTCTRNVQKHAATRGREIFSKYFLQFSFSILHLGGDDALKSFFLRSPVDFVFSIVLFYFEVRRIKFHY